MRLIKSCSSLIYCPAELNFSRKNSNVLVGTLRLKKALSKQFKFSLYYKSSFTYGQLTNSLTHLATNSVFQRERP